MPNWSQVLEEINKEIATSQYKANTAFDNIRRKYLHELHKYTRRNIIAYYSAFLSKPRIEGIDIIDEDKNGFMMAIHELDKSKGLDLFLHTPGGNMAATESLVKYLKSIFGNDIRAIVPQLAMSAGAMIACCCKEILLGKQSSLGPIDPQINGMPAVVVIREFERAHKEIKRDQSRAFVWQPILQKLNPTFLDQCKLVIEWAHSFVKEGLANNMLLDEAKDRYRKAEEIANFLSDSYGNKAHDRHLHHDQLREIGLKVYMIEEDQTLQDLILTIHHCFIHTLSNTGVIKIIENHLGKAYIRQIAPTTQQL